MPAVVQYSTAEWRAVVACVAVHYRRWHALATAVLLAAMCGAIWLSAWCGLHYHGLWFSLGIAVCVPVLIWLLRAPYVLEPRGLSFQQFRAKQLDLAQLSARLLSGDINGTERWEKHGGNWQLSAPLRQVTPEFTLRRVVGRLRLYLSPPLKTRTEWSARFQFVFTLLLVAIIGLQLALTFATSGQAPAQVLAFLARQGWAMALAITAVIAMSQGIAQRDLALLATRFVCPYLAEQFARQPSDGSRDANPRPESSRTTPSRTALTLCMLDQLAWLGRMADFPLLMWGALTSCFLLMAELLSPMVTSGLAAGQVFLSWPLILAGITPLLLSLVACWALKRLDHAGYRARIRVQLEASSLALQLAHKELAPSEVHQLVPRWQRQPGPRQFMPVFPDGELAAIVLELSRNLDFYLSASRRLVRTGVVCNFAVPLAVLLFITAVLAQLPLPVVCLLWLGVGALLIPGVLHNLRTTLWLRELVDYLADRLLG